MRYHDRTGSLSDPRRLAAPIAGGDRTVARTVGGLAVLFALAASAAAQHGYLVDSNNDTLYTIDLNTGAVTAIGSTLNNNLATPADLVWRADTNELWTLDLAGGEVGTLDVSTAQFTQRFTTNLNGWQGMAFEPASGNFILANQDGNNYVLDTRTGSTTLLGTAGTGFGLITALDTDPTGTVWGIDFSTGYVARIDTRTGVATRVSTTLPGMQGLGITAGNVFFATSTNTNSLYTIDPMTGTATLIGSHGGGVTFAKGFDTVEGGCFIAKSGAGCRDGSNTVLDMHWTGRPCINTSNFTLGTTTGPSFPVYLLAIGASNASWNGVPLPFDLSPFGAPGCRIYASQLLVAGVPRGQDLPLAIPNDPTLEGLRLYAQSYVPDPQANALGVAMSNLAVLGIGK